MNSSRPRLFDSLLFLLLLSGPPKFRERDPMASLRGEIDTMVLLHIVVWAWGFLWVLYRLYPLMVRRSAVPRIWAPQIAGMALICTLLLSLWESPGVLLTGFSIFQFAVMLGFAYVFVQAYGVQHYLHHLFWGFALVTIVVVGAWWLAPELVVKGADGRLRGDAITNAGAVAVLTLVLGLCGTPRLKRFVFVAIAGMALVVLAASQTRTAYITLFCFLLFGWIFGPLNMPVKRTAILAPAILLIGVMTGVLMSAQKHMIREEASIASMSDRIPLWEYTIGVMLRESPLVGMGYYSASRVIGPQYNPKLGDAHSAYVEILVGGGLLGGGIFLVMVVALAAYMIRLLVAMPRDPRVIALNSLFLCVVLFSITGSEGVKPGPIGFTFWSLLALAPALWDQMTRTRRAAAGAEMPTQAVVGFGIATAPILYRKLPPAMPPGWADVVQPLGEGE